MNQNENHRCLNNLRKGRMSSTTPFGMLCLVSLIGIFSMVGMLFYPPWVYADSTGTAHINVAPVKLFLRFNSSWSGGTYPDTVHNTAQPGLSCWSLQLSHSGMPNESEAWPYEGQITNSAINSGALASDFDWQEAYYINTYFYDASGHQDFLPIYDEPVIQTARQSFPSLLQNTGATNNPFIYMADSPGVLTAFTHAFFTNTTSYPGLNSIVEQEVLISTPLYKSNPDGTNSSLTIWFTNTASGAWSAMAYRTNN
jgi:hypothetical protein